MNVFLITDFEDYYDHHFGMKEYSDVDFKRISTDKPKGQDMFRLLRKMEFRTPVYGKTKYMLDKLNEFYKKYDLEVTDDDKLIVSLENKEKLLLPIKEAIEKYPNNFSICHIPNIEHPDKNIKSVLHRHVQIGSKFIWLRYSSTNLWVSNEKESTIEILKVSDRPPEFEQPLYAIDYIYAPDYNFYCIGYDTSPILKGTGIENIIGSEEVVRLISEKVKVPVQEYSV